MERLLELNVSSFNKKERRNNPSNQELLSLCFTSKIFFFRICILFGRGMGNCHLMDIEFQFCKMQKLWKFVVQQCDVSILNATELHA